MVVATFLLRYTHRMQRYVLAFWLFAATAAHAQTQGEIVQSPAYKECISLSATNPERALAKADEWLRIDSGVAANHCRAMALYGDKRYSESGDTLSQLRMALPEESLSFRCFIARQASATYVKALRSDAALAVLDQQVADMAARHSNNASVAKLTSEVLLDRARILAQYGKLNLATQDLDHAISLTPLNVEVLIERAKTFEQLGDVPLARADIESALTLNPDNAAARAMLVRLEGRKK